MTDDGPREPTTFGGFTVREYERRVWDMARHLIHPAFLYVLAQIAGATRLLAHRTFDGPAGTAWELALFGAGFLGAWACFFSTLLRDAGIRSPEVAVLCLQALLAAAAIWFAFPALPQMSEGALAAAALLLAGPG